jgi:hypothetical protein
MNSEQRHALTLVGSLRGGTYEYVWVDSVALAHSSAGSLCQFLAHINPIYVFFIFVCWPTNVLKRVAVSLCRCVDTSQRFARDANVETKRTVHVLV